MFPTTSVPHRRFHLGSLLLAAALLAAPANAALIDMATPVTAPPLVAEPAGASLPSLGTDLIESARHSRATLAINLSILALGSLWLALAARRLGQASSAARQPAAAGR